MSQADRPKFTGWYDGDQKPARPGVYQRKLHGEIQFSRWDGEKWYGTMRSKDLAASTTIVSLWACKPWRGIDREVTL